MNIFKKIKENVGIILGVSILGLGLFLGLPANATVFTSGQVGASPAAGDVLQTNGATSTWVTTSSLGISGSGGSGVVGPSTSTWVGVFSSSGTLLGYSNFTFNSSTGIFSAPIMVAGTSPIQLNGAVLSFRNSGNGGVTAVSWGNTSDGGYQGVIRTITGLDGGGSHNDTILLQSGLSQTFSEGGITLDPENAQTITDELFGQYNGQWSIGGKPNDTSIFKVNGSSTVSNLTISALASAGNPCLSVGTGGTVATTTCGTPGGSSTQIQFNNSGAFGGIPSLTINTSTGQLNASSVQASILDTGGFAINVKANGAKCNGTTDDYAAISSTISQVDAGPLGGTVLLPPGNCRTFKELDTPGDGKVINFMGTGMDSSEIQASGTMGNVLNESNPGTLMGFTVDGNAQATDALAVLTNNGIVLDHVTLYSVKAQNISPSGSWIFIAWDLSGGYNINRLDIIDSIIQGPDNPGHDAMALTGVNTAYITNLTIRNVDRTPNFFLINTLNVDGMDISNVSSTASVVFDSGVTNANLSDVFINATSATPWILSKNTRITGGQWDSGISIGNGLTTAENSVTISNARVSYVFFYNSSTNYFAANNVTFEPWAALSNAAISSFQATNSALPVLNITNSKFNLTGTNGKWLSAQNGFSNPINSSTITNNYFYGYPTPSLLNIVCGTGTEILNNFGSSDTCGSFAVTSGGTGTSTTPANGNLLIGNGTGYQFISSSTFLTTSTNNFGGLTNASVTAISPIIWGTTSSISCPTCIATNTGNWAGTWQGVNSSTFPSTSTYPLSITSTGTINCTGCIVSQGTSTYLSFWDGELYANNLFFDSGLIAYYRLEGNSNDSKSTNNGVDTSMAYGLACGRFGQGGCFSGSVSNIVVASATTPFGFGTSSISMVGWVDVTSTNIKGTFFDVGTSLNGYALGVGSDTLDQTGNVLVGTYGGVGWLPTKTLIGTGWHMVAMTIGTATSTANIYLDGALVYTYSGSGTIQPTTYATIGSEGGSRPFQQGYIDDVSFWSRPLTATEIKNLYNQTLGDSLIYQTYGNSIGIGTTQPSSTVHIIGTFKVTSSSTFGGNVNVTGTITQSLFSNSFVWASASGTLTSTGTPSGSGITTSTITIVAASTTQYVTSTINLGNLTYSATGTLNSVQLPTIIVSSQFTTNSGNNYTSSSLIQAIAAVRTTSNFPTGANIYLPDPSYTVTSTMQLASSTWLICTPSTVININTTSTGSLNSPGSALLSGVPGKATDYGGIQNCNLTNTSSGYSGTAFDMSNFGHFFANNVQSTHFRYSIYANDTVNATFYNNITNWVGFDDSGIFVSSTQPVNRNEFFNDTFFINQSNTSSSKAAFYLNNGQDNAVYGAHSEPAFPTGTVGIYLTAGAINVNQLADDNAFYSSYLEGNQTSTLIAANGSNVPLRNQFYGGEWLPSATVSSTQYSDAGFDSGFFGIDNNGAGAIYSTPITASSTYIDNSNASQGITFKNNTSFAHTGGTPLVNMKMLNGTDSDTLLNLSNAGSGNTIVVNNGTTNTMTVASSGQVTLGANSTNPWCVGLFMRGTSTKYYMTFTSSTGDLLTGVGFDIVATSTKPPGC